MMFKNLSFNRYTKSFHLSNNPFACVKAHEKVGYFGKTVKLSGSVYALLTPGKLEEARRESITGVQVVHTKWPRLKLLVAFIKEVVND